MKKIYLNILLTITIFTTSLLYPINSLIEIVKAGSAVNTIEFGVIKDSFSTPSTPYPDRHVVSVGETYWLGDTFVNTWGLVQFQPISIPTGAIIKDIWIEVWQRNSQDDNTLVVGMILNDWNETNPGYPSIDGAHYAAGTFMNYSVSDFGGPVYRRIDIDNQDLINYLKSPNYGVVFRNAAGDSDDGVFICSSDNVDPGYMCNATHSPVIKVEYVLNQKPDTPNPISPNNSTYINGNCDESVVPATGICRTPINQTLTANVNDPDDIAEIDMKSSKFHLSGVNNIVSPEIYADNWSPVNYAANLNDGVTYWNVQSTDNQGLTSNFSQTFSITTDTTPPTVPVLNTLLEWTPAVGLNQTTQVTVTAPKISDNVSTKEEVGYVLQYSKDLSFDPAVSEVFEYSSQYFSNPVDQSATFQIGPKGLDQIEGTLDDLVDGNTYYFRSKAHDKAEVSGEKNTSAWSNIVSTSIDGTLPEITNYSVIDNRFSPNNATSVGIKDSITFSFDYSELHPSEAKIEIYSDEAGTNLIKSLVKLDLAPSPEPTALSFEWDGKDNAGNYIADGPYVAFAIMTDLAGNRSYGNLDFNATNIPSEVIIVDNNEANISISSPYNNYWTNVLNLDITGQVKAPHDEGEEDQDLENFQITISNTQTAKDVSYDSLGLFTQNVDLDPGKNDFNFKSTDTVGNTGEKSLTIYTENIAPEISNVLPTGLSNNRKPVISFDIVDPNTNSDLNQVSNIPVGVNPKDMQVWLTFNSLDQNKNIISNTKKLIENGVNLDPALVGDLTCTANTSIVDRNNLDSAESASCSLPFLAELQPDSTYQIHIQASDIAENQTTNDSTSFKLDSHVLNEVYTPVDQGIYSTSDILFTGKASRYSELTIKNEELKIEEIIYIDEPTLIPADSQLFISDSLDLKCGEFVDIDNRFDTPDEEICSYGVRVKQSFFNQDKDKINVNTVTVSDEAGNVITRTLNLVINLYKFDLTVASDLEYFSPNGDGRQDGLVFTHSAVNPSDPINSPRIANYKIQITNSKNGNPLIIRTLEGVNNLPAYTIFDGKYNDPSTPNNQFTWLPDGAYQYYLEVTTVDGATVKTEPKAIFAKTELTNELFITSPQTGFVTTEGVVTISGQAPTDQSTDGTGVLRGDVKVLICVDTITPETPADCDGWYEVSADSNGFFSSIVVLPRIGSYDQTTHIVTAVAQDQFGNRTEESNAVSIILDTVDPFTSVSITPSLTGITSDADYEKFLNGEISIDQIRTVKLTANVSQNTEQVQFALADFTNPLTGSPYYVKPENVDYNFIALVNNQTESSTQLNPFADPAIKANHEVQIGTNIPSNYCNQTNCSWSYYMPLYTGYAGTYEVGFTGKKGETIQSMTAGFRVDGSIQSAPIIMIVEKWDEETDTWIKLDNVNLAHYTEGGKLRFRGAADPGTYLELVGKNADGTNVVLASVTVPETGVFEMIIDLDPLLKAPGNGNGEGNGLECREWKTGEGNEKKCVKGDFNFGLIGWEVDENGNLVNPVEGENGVEITYDEVLPGAESIVRTTEELAIEGWAKTGDQAKFLLTANEELQYADVLKEDGYQVLMSKLFHFNVILSGVEGWAGVINIDRKSEGIYYPQIRLVDQSGNIQSYDSKALCGVAAPGSELQALSSFCDFRIFIDNTKPDPTYIDKSEWSTTWEEGGINASPYTEGSGGQGRYSPEVGRTNPEYVIKSDYVTIRGKAEKNQRVELHITTGTPTQILGTSILNPLKKEVVYVPVSNSNCQLPISNQKDKVTQDGLTVKYAESCDWSYTYTFKDDGSNSWDGVPNHGYTFQVRTIDKAANYSEFTKQEIVYHDKQAPNKPTIVDASSVSYSPIINWSVDGLAGLSLTKDMNVTLSSYAERFADLSYEIRSPRSGTQNVVALNTTNMQSAKQITLGDQVKDDRTGCVQDINGRRTGICSDGVYELSLQAIDAAGNDSVKLENVDIERDTVAPAKANPKIEIISSTHTLNAAITNLEPGANVYIKVYASSEYTQTNGQSWFYSYIVPSTGILYLQNIVGIYYPATTYTIEVIQQDKAQNVGQKATYSIKTPAEGFCISGSNTGLTYPLRGNFVQSGGGSFYDTRFYEGAIHPHGGIDWTYYPQDNPLTKPIYAAGYGYISYMGTDQFGGLYTDIVHPQLLGLKTRYVHMSSHNAELYQRYQSGETVYVDINTVIGIMGSTGLSSGPHLHFEVMNLWGVKLDPLQYLGECRGFGPEVTDRFDDSNVLGETDERNLDQVVGIFEHFIKTQLLGNTEIAIHNDSNYEVKKVNEITDLKSELTTTIHKWCGYYVLDFNYIEESNGANGYVGNAILNPYDNQVFLVKNAIRQKYVDTYGPCGELGLPTFTAGAVGEQFAGISSKSIKNGVTSGVYQNFQHGQIYWHWNNKQGKSYVNTVYGEIYNKYDDEGGTWSWYGFPTSDQNEFGCQNFENGEICTPGQNLCRDLKDGEYDINLDNDIEKYYWDKGGCSFFGLPKSNQYKKHISGKDMWIQDFEYYSVYRFKTGGFLGFGEETKIFHLETNTSNYYKNSLGDYYSLGLPIDSTKELSTCGNNGYYSLFENGEIHFVTGQQIKFIYGDLYKKYEEEGGISRFGLAMSNMDSRVPNGISYYGTLTQDFDNGYIDMVDFGLDAIFSLFGMYGLKKNYQSDLSCWTDENNLREMTADEIYEKKEATAKSSVYSGHMFEAFDATYTSIGQPVTTSDEEYLNLIESNLQLAMNDTVKAMTRGYLLQKEGKAIPLQRAVNLYREILKYNELIDDSRGNGGIIEVDYSKYELKSGTGKSTLVQLDHDVSLLRFWARSVNMNVCEASGYQIDTLNCIFEGIQTPFTEMILTIDVIASVAFGAVVIGPKIIGVGQAFVANPLSSILTASTACTSSNFCVEFLAENIADCVSGGVNCTDPIQLTTNLFINFWVNKATEVPDAQLKGTISGVEPKDINEVNLAKEIIRQGGVDVQFLPNPNNSDTADYILTSNGVKSVAEGKVLSGKSPFNFVSGEFDHALDQINNSRIENGIKDGILLVDVRNAEYTANDLRESLETQLKLLYIDDPRLNDITIIVIDK